MYWMQHVFDPLTKSRANGKPRILISDGFGSHESLEVMTFCFENDILLCRLPSHTSHKLQPCDVAVFAPLKTAYREQVERLYRGGAEVIGKQHFTLLYSHAREAAITARNIRAGWSKAGLFPFNPDRVLRDLAQPPSFDDFQSHGNMLNGSEPAPVQTPLKTPTNSASLDAMRTQLDRVIGDIADEASKTHVKKVVNAVEQSFAKCALLADENRLLMAQNSEKKVRKSVKATVVGRAKVMKYEDIVQARERRCQGLDSVVNKAPRKRKHGSSAREPVKKCAKKSSGVNLQAEAEAAIYT